MNSRSRKTRSAVLAAVLASILLLVTTSVAFAEQAPEVVKIAFTDPPTLSIGEMEVYHPSYAAMLAFKGAFEKSTGGRYVVELYPYGTLGDAASNLEQMISGTLQGGTPADGALAPFYANIQVFSIPYLFDTALTAYDVLDGEFGQNLYEDMAGTAGLRIISSYDNGGYRNFTNSKRPIRTAEDMNNLKIRTMDIPVHMEIVKAMGASPTPIAFMELYSALQTGVVDGQENSAVTMLGASLQEVQSYATLDGHLLGMAFLTISEDWYQSLSPEDQQACLRAGREGSFAARGIVRYAESLALDTLKESGVEVYTPTDEEMETFKIAQEPAIDWLKTNIDPELVDELLAVVASGTVGTAVPPAAGASVGPAASGGAVSGAAPSGTAAQGSSGSMTTTVVVIAVVVLVIVAFAAFRKKKTQTTQTADKS